MSTNPVTFMPDVTKKFLIKIKPIKTEGIFDISTDYWT